jgi:TonB family protein
VEPELHLLTDWSDPDGRSRRRKAAIGAIAVNVALIVTMALLPEGAFRPPDLPQPEERVTPIVMPPLTELTQKDPNHGKISKDFEVQAPVVARKAIEAPTTPPPSKRGAAPAPPVPQPAAPAPLPEAPKVEAAHDTPPAELPRQVQQAAAPPPPPQPQIQEQPKLTFESVPPPITAPLPPDQRKIPLPQTNINEIARQAAAGSPIGLTIGDAAASESGYNGLSQSPAQGNPLANVQLKSDTEGVDFRPYLLQLIATVKRNWLAVIPQSAHMGRHGKVALQFAINKEGKIDKVVFAENSGSSALDRAAVAGISASDPLPPLPRDFKGARIVLQLNFVYR